MKTKFTWLATLLVLLTVALAHAQGLPTATPEQVGLSSERLRLLMTTLRNDVEKGEIPGAIVFVARHGRIAWFEAVGMRDPQTKTPMTKDTIFRIYSMTKPITSVAAMILVEDGKLALGDPVSKYIPQLAKTMNVAVEKAAADGTKTEELVPVVREMTIHDLFRHSAGLTYGFFGDTPAKRAYLEKNVGRDPSITNAELMDQLASVPLGYQPGTTWDYSHATDVLGRVIEVVSGTTLYRFDKERILDPLGMRDTSFYVTDQAKQGRVAEPFANDRTIGTGSQVGDPRIEGRYEPGGGGMVSTVMDYARFLQMLVNGGRLDGKRILGPKTVAYMTSDHLGSVITPGPYYLPGPGFGFGLGFAVRKEAGVSPVEGSVGEYNWGGAGGTYFWVDPKEDMFVIYMMQSPSKRVYYRTILKNMVYSAISMAMK
jgi:CubicO group peptidase (beta-lactamase class C family)